MSTNTQRVTLKSPKMSGNDDKQLFLCCTKAIFADFSKSTK